MKRIHVLRHRFWSIVCGAEIPINCQIGGGLLLPHPNGIVIASDAVVGPNCLIFHQVTLGSGDPNLVSRQSAAMLTSAPAPRYWVG
jgi:serine O-acetyltransferase